jgi:hypothetical protein
MVLAGCSPSAAPGPPPGAKVKATPSPASAPVPRRDAAGVVWLCRPGLARDPCLANLQTTTVDTDGTRLIYPTAPDPASQQPYNCFYLYPTASNERTVNANLAVQPAETQIAFAQAAPFSQVCSVWAPIYRQLTVSGISAHGPAGASAGQVAFASVLAAWSDFIAHYDDGRPIIFIGHSQGSIMLIRLLAQYVDPNPAMRKLVVEAIIAGGNVTVPDGKTAGVTFRHLPLCTATGQVHCVIAYSSFPSEPPADSNFGRPGQGMSLNSGQTATSGVQIACVNPASIAGGTADLTPEFPVYAPFPMTPMSPPGGLPITTPWVTYRGLYSASCQTADGATWLQVTDLDPHARYLPAVTEPLLPDRRLGHRQEPPADRAGHRRRTLPAGDPSGSRRTAPTWTPSRPTQ